MTAAHCFDLALCRYGAEPDIARRGTEILGDSANLIDGYLTASEIAALKLDVVFRCLIRGREYQAGRRFYHSVRLQHGRGGSRGAPALQESFQN
jgi:hypothetical protein